MPRKQTPASVKGATNPDLKSTPPATQGSQRLLPLEQVNDFIFEAICVDLAELEPNIVRADLKRTSGVKQFGVDVEAFSDDQAPVLVISSKRYQKVIASEIRKWGRDFRNEFEAHWKNRSVQKFVLAVTVELNDDNLNKAIRDEATEFKALGLKYEVWGLSQLTKKLRQSAATILQYMHPGWVEAIGANASITSAAGLPNTGAAALGGGSIESITQGLNSVVAVVGERLGSQLAHRLDDVLKRLAEGIVTPLKVLIGELRGDHVSWDTLPNDVKAKFLRAEARLAFRAEDAANTRRLYLEAAVYHTAMDRTAEAQITRLESGAEAALASLESPANPAEFSLRAALLIELDNAVEASVALTDWAVKHPDTDVHDRLRLTALVEMMLGHRQAAVVTIEAAEALAPSNYATLWAGAIVRYHAAISPKAAPELGSFPNPTPSGLLLDTEVARHRLDEAAAIFKRLAETVDDCVDAENLSVWRLACLIGNPDRALDAETLGKSLTSGDAPHAGAIVWSAAAGIDIEVDDVVRSLTKRLKAGSGNSSDVVAIAFLWLRRGNRQRASRALKRWRPSFTDASSVALIDHWSGMVAETKDGSLTGEFRRALGAVEGDQGQDLHTLLDGGRLSADMLLAAFETMAIAGQWAEIDQRADKLLAIGTPYAVELAVRAADENGDPEKAIRLLGEHAGVFYKAIIPARLQVLQANANLQMGRPDLALKVLEGMPVEGGSGDTAAMRLAWLKLQIGDRSGAAHVIRGKAIPADSPPQVMLQIASEIRHEDPALARSLAEEVARRKIDDALILSALGVFNDLGMAEAFDALRPRVDALPEGLVIKVDNVEQALEWAAENARHHQRHKELLQEKWLSTEIPLHMVFDTDVADLAEYFHRPFVDPAAIDATGKLNRLPFLLRSGHIHEQSEATKHTYGNLDLDVTALLLANELQLVEQLKHIAKAVRVAPETPGILLAIENGLNRRYGDLDAGLGYIEEALTNEDLAVSADLGAVTLLTLSLDSEDGRKSVDAAAVLSYLVNQKGLDATKVGEGLAKLGLSIGPVPADFALEIEYCCPIRVAVALARAGLLPELLRFVRVAVQSSETAALRAELRAHRDGMALAKSIGELRRLLAKKLAAGDWTLLVAPVGKDVHADAGVLARSFVSVLHSCERDGGELWIEDRTLTGHSIIGKKALVGIHDIVGRLERAKKLRHSDATAVRRKLLRSGYGFILPDVDYVVALLREAPVSARGLVESDGLAEVRQNLAVHLANGRYLVDRQVPIEQMEKSELIFLSRLMGFCSKVLAQIWNAPNLATGRRVSMSAWVWLNLRFGQVDFLPRDDRSPTAKRNLNFLQHLSLFTTMLHLKTPKASGAKRKDFLNWACSSILDPLVDVEPEFETTFVEQVAGALGKLATPSSDYPDISPNIMAAVIDDYISAFPEHWGDRLRRHPAVSAIAGYREIGRVQVGGFSFKADDFYKAINTALRSGTSRSETWSGGAIVDFAVIVDQPDRDDVPATFTLTGGSETAHLSDDLLEMESDDPDRRFRALMRHPDWFDGVGVDLEAQARALASMADPVVRRQHVLDVQTSSISWRLNTLSNSIRDRTSSDRSLVQPPTPESVRRHVAALSDARLTLDASSWLAAGYLRLRERIGPLPAIRRLGGLPFDLPLAAVEDLGSALKSGESDKVLAQLGPSPMVLTAVLVAAGDRPEVGASVVEAAARSWQRFGTLFHSILALAHKSVGTDAAWMRLEAQEREMLLWLHASSVLDAMIVASVDPKGTADLLDGYGREPLTSLFQRGHVGRRSYLDPTTITDEWMAGAAVFRILQARCVNSCSGETLDALRRAVGDKANSRWYPAVALLMPPTPNVRMASWLEADPLLGLAGYDLFSVPEPFEDRDPSSLATRMIETMTMQNVPEGTGYWPLLWRLGLSGIDAATLQAIEGALSNTGLAEALDAENGNFFVAAISYRAELLAKRGDYEGMADLVRSSAREAQRVAGRGAVILAARSDDDIGQKAFFALIEASWKFCAVAFDDMENCFSCMGDLIVAIYQEWPESLVACLSMLDTLAQQLPVAQAAGIWNAINRLRAA